MSVERLRGRILLDTNVLIYATLDADPRFERAREVLSLRSAASVEVFVSVQNLAEMYPNLTGPKNSRPDSPELARLKIQSIAGLDSISVLPLNLPIARRALELCEHYSITRQRYSDMQLAATMIEERIDTIVTENAKDFDRIEGISVVNPFSG